MTQPMTHTIFEQVQPAVERFIGWLDEYGETSLDFQSFYASRYGRSAKALYYRRPLLGTLAVSPMVFCEALFPPGRRFFSRPQRFPIADAHYAMAFAMLAGGRKDKSYYERAVHFLRVLEETRCPNRARFCWGYPFHWETKTGTIPAGTPLITTVPYVYEAFSAVYEIDRDPAWLRTMHSVAEHAYWDYRNLETAPLTASCSYSPAPYDECEVVNASAYRAFMLTKAGVQLSEPRYLEAAKQNLNFVVASQGTDGSWHYSTDGRNNFIDHFHTCFVLKALAKMEELTGWPECGKAIEQGVDYYLTRLFDGSRLPIPFSKAPRLTVYQRELYDYAECINLAVLLYGRFAKLDSLLPVVAADLLQRWQKPDGSFRSRELRIGWDNVPMHRWAQSQVFRSLCFLLSRGLQKNEGRVVTAASSFAG